MAVPVRKHVLLYHVIWNHCLFRMVVYDAHSTDTTSHSMDNPHHYSSQPGPSGLNSLTTLPEERVSTSFVVKLVVYSVFNVGILIL